MITAFAVGQRWASEMEPELGVGIVDAISGRRIHLRFPKGGLTRIYAIESAPIRRIVFHPGDRIQSDTGETMTVASVVSEAGLKVYCGQGMRLQEDRLAGTLVLDTPQERLMAGQRDASILYDLRCRVLEYRHRIARSPVHGFVGGRVDLIPHQFAIAAEVSGRRPPRVLLADETGLVMARTRSLPVIEEAHRVAGQAMDEAVNRMETLCRENPAISDLEINGAGQERDAVLSAVSTARVRLDAMRLIVKGLEFYH